MTFLTRAPRLRQELVESNVARNGVPGILLVRMSIDKVVAISGVAD
ncbi:hypothetical protein ACGFWI_34185 [Streptomyces sp. NPDC048434]